MNSLDDDIRIRGGFATTRELLRAGHTSHALTRAVRSGAIIRVRNGHYATTDRSDAEIRAVRVGGRLSGMSAAKAMGMWTPDNFELGVAVHPHARALRNPADKTRRLSTARAQPAGVRWADASDSGTRAVVSAIACVLHIARTETPMVAFAVAESAVKIGLFSLFQFLQALDSLPSTRWGRLASVGDKSESGGESLFAFHLLELGIAFEQQVSFALVGTVDFVLHRNLVVEIDGAAFHTSATQFENDRRRDALLASRGIRVLRFSYNQVDLRWPEVLAALTAAMADVAR